MRESFLQILRYLFRHHDIQGALRQSNKSNLLAVLHNVGFDVHDARTAVAWLHGFKKNQRAVNKIATPTSDAIRVFTDSEMQKLDVEVRGFIHSLQQSGLLDSIKCEVIIERAMSLESPRIGLRDLHYIINVILTDDEAKNVAQRQAYLLLLLPKNNPQ